MTGLQSFKLYGSTKKTLWQLCQLVVIETPGECGDQAVVWGCALHLFTKIEPAGRRRIVHKRKHTGHRLQCKAKHYFVLVNWFSYRSLEKWDPTPERETKHMHCTCSLTSKRLPGTENSIITYKTTPVAVKRKTLLISKQSMSTWSYVFECHITLLHNLILYWLLQLGGCNVPAAGWSYLHVLSTFSVCLFVCSSQLTVHVQLHHHHDHRNGGRVSKFEQWQLAQSSVLVCWLFSQYWNQRHSFPYISMTLQKLPRKHVSAKQKNNRASSKSKVM